MIDQAEITRINEQVRAILKQYLGPQKPEEKNPAVEHELAHGIECMLAITAVFQAINTYHPSYVLSAIQTLMWGLDRNLFWKQHNATLLPLAQSGFNSLLTHYRLLNDQHQTPEKAILIEDEKLAWLRIFPACIGCMWGAPRMYSDTHAMMQELYRVFK